ncbi:MAG: FAD-dependent thymidylate synthase [Rhodospirillaceae bacterium]
MSMLLFAPTATVVASSMPQADGLEHWAEAMGYGDLLDDETTPLAAIMRNSSGEEASGADTLPEFAGRFCYRSFKKGRPSNEYIDHILESGHGSVLEHVSVSFAITGVSRALTHELIRHRAGTAISQESQRYVDAKSVNFVVPPLLVYELERLKAEGNGAVAQELTDRFQADCDAALENYLFWQKTYRAQVRDSGEEAKTLIKKRSNEAARSLLPNATETRLVWTMNLRAARHVVELRGHRDADLEIRRLACMMARKMKEVTPLVFHDVEVFTDEDGLESVRAGYRKV